MRLNDSDSGSESGSDSSLAEDGDIRPGSVAGSTTTDEDSQASGVSSAHSRSSSEISTSSSDVSSNSTASDVQSDGSSIGELNVLDLYQEDPQELQVAGGRRSSISTRVSEKRRNFLEQKLIDPGNLDANAKSGDSEEGIKDQYSDSSDSESESSNDLSDSEDTGALDDYNSDDEDAKCAAIERRHPMETGGVPIETLIDFGTILWKVSKHTHAESSQKNNRHHTHKPRHFTTKEVVREIIKPLCRGVGKSGCSLLQLLQMPQAAEGSLKEYKFKRQQEIDAHPEDAELVARNQALIKYLKLPKYTCEPRRATVFVSHAWNNKLNEVIESVAHFEKTKNKDSMRKRDKKLYFWIDIFCVNQFRPLVSPRRCPDKLWFERIFPEFLKTINLTLVILLPWDKPVVLTRSWCIYEIIASRQKKARVSFQYEPRRQEKFLRMLDDHYDRAKNVIDDNKIDVDYSRSRSKDAQEKIFEVCFERIDHGSMYSVNKMVKDVMHSWSRDIALHKLKTKLVHLCEHGIEMEDMNNTSTTSCVKENSFCVAFGCTEFFDRTEDIRNNYINKLSLVQFMARLYMEQEDYENAENMYKMCLKGEKTSLPFFIEKLFREVEGDMTVDELKAMKDDEARLEDSHRRTGYELIRSIKHLCGDHSPPTMILLGNLAVLYMKQGRDEVAERQLKECLQMKERVLGPKHESTLGTVLNLAAFYRDRASARRQKQFTDEEVDAKNKNDELVSKDYNSSVLQYRRALLAQEELYGENSEVTMATVEALASLNLEMDKTDDTLGYLERILTTKTVQLGKNDPETLAVLENIAGIHSARGNYERAREFYTRAKAAREALFQRAHPSTLAVYSQLAQLEERLGDFKKAREMYDSMVDGVIKTLGRSHFRLYMIMDKQIQCDIMTGDCTDEEAYSMTFELFTKAETVLGMNDPVSQTITHHLGDCLVKLKRYKEALIYFRKCYIARKEQLGPDESYTLVVQYGLAYCLANSKNFREAHSIFEELLQRFDKHPEFGRDHDKTISTVKSYLDVCKISGDKSNVEILLRRLHKHYTAKLGHDHPTTMGVISDLNQSYLG